MFQKNVFEFPVLQSSTNQFNQHGNQSDQKKVSPPSTSPTPIPNAPRLALVGHPAAVGHPEAAPHPSALFDLIAVAAHRGSAFLAEAAVLVLVLALLDRFMLKGHLERNWAIGAFTLSLLLLAASILTDFTSRRYLPRRRP